MRTTTLSIVIPTFGRESVLLDTISSLLQLKPRPLEIVVVDQTQHHEPATIAKLQSYDALNEITWIKLPQPSIPAAMNKGLRFSRADVVLFLDDDVVPSPSLIASHLSCHERGYNVVAGQVLQPGETPVCEEDEFCFASNRPQCISEFMGGNVSINRTLAISVGGFDENFVQVAYRFEAEFSERVMASGEQIIFEPKASIRHLKAERGGTRSYGHHLTTIKPSHAVGAYYFLLRSRNVSQRLLSLVGRPFRAIRTKHHATHPWWIPATLAAEAMGFMWAVFLYLRGPRLFNSQNSSR